MSAARARGLGTAWTSLHLAYEREVAELLVLPEDIHQSSLIPTAYYTGYTFRPASRRSLVTGAPARPALPPFARRRSTGRVGGAQYQAVAGRLPGAQVRGQRGRR
jgi:nitroreductase